MARGMAQPMEKRAPSPLSVAIQYFSIAQWRHLDKPALIRETYPAAYLASLKQLAALHGDSHDNKRQGQTDY
jgi:hypothetical protein